ncbi:MAG: DUF6544 family protein [Gemmatimonas sp.]
MSSLLRLRPRFAAAAMLALTIGCTPLTDRFDEAVATAAASQTDTPPTVVTEADLTPLPAPVGRWLRRVGVVGRPRVRNFVVDMHAQLNRGPDEPWMETPVLQVSFVANPTRLFLLRTRMKGLPVTGLHAYTDDGARMQIRVAGLVDMVDESGDAFTRAETVTMLNDVCIMAPGALLDERFTWRALTDTSAVVTFTTGAHRVSATLVFDANDDLVDFASDDRHALPDDGERWTTPLRGHRDVDGLRLPREGDAIWHYANKPAWRYGRFTILRLQYNVPDVDLPRAAAIGAHEATAR